MKNKDKRFKKTSYLPLENHIYTAEKRVEDISSQYEQTSTMNDENNLQEISKNINNTKKEKKKRIWSIIFLLINVVIVVIILMQLINSDNYAPLTSIDLNFLWLFAGLCAFGALVLFDQFRFYILIKKTTKMSRPDLAYKVGAYGKYYDFITPFSTGGQPFQIYYLSSRGLKAGDAVSIPIAKYIAQQVIFIVFSAIMIIMGFTAFRDFLPFDADYSQWVMLACWIGFICNLALVLLVVLLSIGSFGKKFVLGILKLLCKIKLIKNYDEKYAKLMQLVEDYQRTFKFFAKSPKMLVVILFTSLLSFIVQYSVPFFIFCAFGGTPNFNDWFMMLIVAIMIELAASFIPMPGGSGVAEVSFTVMFASSFQSASFWALLFWRLLVYYSFIFQGFGLLIYDAVRGNKKNKKKKEFYKEKYPEYYK